MAYSVKSEKYSSESCNNAGHLKQSWAIKNQSVHTVAIQKHTKEISAKITDSSQNIMANFGIPWLHCEKNSSSDTG